MPYKAPQLWGGKSSGDSVSGGGKDPDLYSWAEEGDGPEGVSEAVSALGFVKELGARVFGVGRLRRDPDTHAQRLDTDVDLDSLERGEAPTVYEDGEQMRDFVHVTDVARANLASLDAVLEAPAGHHRAYNVASGHPVGIRRVAELVAEGTGRDLAPEVTGGYRLGDVRHIVASPERARAELGFSAEVLPDVGLPAFATAPLRA